jgi:hypothetical protein
MVIVEFASDPPFMDSGDIEIMSDLGVVVQMPLFLTFRVLNAQSICNIEALCTYQFYKQVNRSQ